jgi:hypothetical protein
VAGQFRNDELGVGQVLPIQFNQREFALSRADGIRLDYLKQ